MAKSSSIAGLAAAILLLAADSLFAHDPGLSSADVTVENDRISVELTLNERDWGSTGVVTPQSIQTECLALTLNGVPLLPTGSTGPTPDHIQNVSCTLTYPKAGAGQLFIRSLLFSRLPFGHREFIKIHNAEGRILAEQMLHMNAESCEINLLADSRQQPSPGSANTFMAFLLLGVRHILTGYDHMLFLAGLLLVCSGFRQAAAVITYFTAAHSITLVLSALSIVSVPARIVEPAVAASIAYVGVENILRPANLKWRGLIAFSFGLVHGLGFAGVLRGMGIGSGGTGLAIPLVSFNVGVELGQLSVALAVLPVIFVLRNQPAFLRIGTPAISSVVALLGAWWFLQRTVMS